MIAATGELARVGELAEINVWNVETKEILAALSGFHVTAVRQVRDSRRVAAVLSQRLQAPLARGR